MDGKDANRSLVIQKMFDYYSTIDTIIDGYKTYAYLNYQIKTDKKNIILLGVPQMYTFYNEDQNMYINIWDYDDEILSEAYLENSSSYRIVSGENNTYNFVFDSYNDMDHVISYITKGYVALDCGVLEIAEVDGKKQIILVSKEGTNVDSLKTCYDELMKFNQNNNIEPIADAI